MKRPKHTVSDCMGHALEGVGTTREPSLTHAWCTQSPLRHWNDELSGKHSQLAVIGISMNVMM